MTPPSGNRKPKIFRISPNQLTDATLARDPRAGQYTFWDYQAGAWNKNNGIRIDHFLLSPACADMLIDTGIDKDIRAREKPSDHVPIWVALKV